MPSPKSFVAPGTSSTTRTRASVDLLEPISPTPRQSAQLETKADALQRACLGRSGEPAANIVVLSMEIIGATDVGMGDGCTRKMGIFATALLGIFAPALLGALPSCFDGSSICLSFWIKRSSGRHKRSTDRMRLIGSGGSERRLLRPLCATALTLTSAAPNSTLVTAPLLPR